MVVTTQRLLVAYSYTPFQPHDKVAVSVVQAVSNLVSANLVDVIRLPVVHDSPNWASQVAAIRMVHVGYVYQGRLNRLITLDYPAHALTHPEKIVWLHQVAAEMPEPQQRYLHEAKHIFGGSRAVVDGLKRHGIDSQLLELPTAAENPGSPTLHEWQAVIRRLMR